MIASQHEQVNDISIEMDGFSNTPNEAYQLEYEDSFSDMSTYNESYRMEYDDDTKDEQNVIYHHPYDGALIQLSCSREYEYLLSDEEEEGNGQSEFVMKRKFATFTEGLSSKAKQVTQRLYVSPGDECSVSVGVLCGKKTWYMKIIVNMIKYERYKFTWKNALKYM